MLDRDRKCNRSTNRDQMTAGKERVKNVELPVLRMASWFVMMYDNYSERGLCNQLNRSTF